MNARAVAAQDSDQSNIYEPIATVHCLNCHSSFSVSVAV